MPTQPIIYFDKNVDLKHVKVKRKPPPLWFAGIAVGVALIGLTSWAANRDELANAQDRVAVAAKVPPRPALTIKITRNGIVEAETERCWAVANTRKGTTYQTCAD